MKKFCSVLALLFTFSASAETLTRRNVNRPYQGPIEARAFTVAADPSFVTNSLDFTLTAVVTGASSYSHRWSQISGPTTATIDTPTALASAIHVSGDGIFVFKSRAYKWFFFATTTVEVQVEGGGVRHYPPTITAISDVETDEDVAAGPLSFTVADTETVVTSLTVTKSSSNQSVLLDSGISITGSGGSKQVTLTPIPDANGTSVVTLTVTDGDGQTATVSFSATWNPVNDPPILDAIGNLSTPEDTAKQFNITYSDVESIGSFLFVSISTDGLIASSSMTGTGGSRTVTLTPVANATGVSVVSVYVTDGQYQDSETFNLTITGVNDAPTIAALADIQTTNGVARSFTATINDVDDAATTLTLTKQSSNPTALPLSGIAFTGTGASRTVTLTPAAAGTSVVTIGVVDTHGASNTASMTFFVGSANTAPTITPPSTQTILEDATATTIAFTAVDTETAPGLLVYSATSSDQSKVKDSSIVLGGSGSARTITVTPEPDANGSCTISITAVDSGGLSDTEGFTLNITAQNDPPSITQFAAQSTGYNTAKVLTVQVSDKESAVNTLVTSGTSSDQTLVPNASIVYTGGAVASRTCTITPASSKSGTTTITLTCFDGTDTSTSVFVLTVVAGNVSPSISSIANQTPNEDTATSALAFTISDPETTASSLTVFGSSSDQSKIADSGIVFGGSAGSRTVTVTPVLNANGGPTTITVGVSDGTNSTTTSFTITLTPVEDSPTMAAIANQNTAEDTAKGISVAINDVDTTISSLIVSGTSLDQTLLPNANIVATGTGTTRTVTMTPGLNQTGSTTVTLSVTDGTSTPATRSFTFSVAAVNDPPTITTPATQTTLEDTATSAIAFGVGDVETAVGSLTVSAISSDPLLVASTGFAFGGSGASRTVTITPVANASGSCTITLNVSDGTDSTNSTFTLNVTPVNDHPTITQTASPQTILEDSSGLVLALTIGDVETAAGSLTLTRASGNTTLVPLSGIVFGGSGANRTATITPAFNQNGSALITLVVSDGTDTTTNAFTLVVTAQNDQPLLTGIAATYTLTEDIPLGATSFGVNDSETAATSLTVSAVSADHSILLDSGITFSGTGATRSFIITPVANAFGGPFNVTFTLSDGVAVTNVTTAVTVTSNNDQPTITSVGNQTMATGTISVGFTVGDVEDSAGSLTVTRASSNTGLLPLSGLVLSGSGAGRFLAITPTSGQTGTATVALGVLDSGGLTNFTTFTVTVNGTVNTAPVISTIAAVTIPVNTSTVVPFTVSDAETPSAGLTVTASSDNPTLTPSLVLASSGNPFTKWQTDDVDSTALPDITFTMAADHIATAVYGSTTPASWTLGVTASIANTPITVSPADSRGLSSANSPFPRVYASGATITLTAPATSGTGVFQKWTLNGADYAITQATTVTMSRDQLMKAVYSNSGSANLITTQTLGTVRSDVAGPRGMKITVGGTALSVTALGRWIVSGNAGTHLLKLTDATTLADLAGGSVTLNTVGQTAGAYAFANLAAPVTLAAGSSYYLTSTEAAGGDQWYSFDTTVTPTAAATIPAAAYFAPDWNTIGTANQSYGPVNLRYGSGGAQATRDLFVASANPVTGATITATTDTLGQANGATPLARTYTLSGSATLTASQGANRNLTITPAAGVTGTANITVTCTDPGGLASTKSFVLTVNAGNQPPTISPSTPAATFNEDLSTTFSLNIADDLTPVGSLVVSVISDNPALVDATAGDVTITGTGASRTVVVHNRLNQSGTATLIFKVTDGTFTSSAAVTITVQSQNDPPTISPTIATQTTGPSTAIVLNLTLADVETAAASLTLTGTALDTTLISSVVAGGSGASRTITITPAAGQNGQTTVTITAKDNNTPVQGSTSQTFTVIVSASGEIIRYVGPSGVTGNTGLTTASPWNIGSVLGDTGTGMHTPADGWKIVILPGTYSGRFVLKGAHTGSSAANAVRYVALNPPYGPIAEQTIFDRNDNHTGDGCIDFGLGSSGIWVEDLVVVDSALRQPPNAGADRGNPFYVPERGNNNKIINCVVRGGANGVGFEDAAIDGDCGETVGRSVRPSGNFEIYGVHSGYNGLWLDDCQHGHGFYIQAKHPSYHLYITDCVSANNMGQGFQNRAGDQCRKLYNTHLTGLVAFNNGFPCGSASRNIFFGGGDIDSGFSMRSNISYYPGAGGPGGLYTVAQYTDSGHVGGPPANVLTNLLVSDNFIIQADFMFGRWNPANVFSNTFISTSARPGMVFQDPFGIPSGTVDWNDIWGPFPYAFDTDGANMDPVSQGTWQGKGFGAHDTLHAGAYTATKIWIRQNAYAPKRFLIIVYNPSGGATVNFSMGAFVPDGTGYRLWSVTDHNRVFTSGQIAGNLTLQMTGFPMETMVGFSDGVNYFAPNLPRSPEPYFGCFQMIID